MAAVGLLYVGAVLFVNGLALMGVVKGKALIPMNLFVGLLQVITPLYLIFTARGDQSVIVGASGLFLFGFTYLYVAMNNAFDYDGTGLGWFSLFVAVAAVIYAYWNFSNYSVLSKADPDVGDLLGVLWTSWAVLWFLFFLVLGLGMAGLTRFTGGWTACLGISTGLTPAIILLNFPHAIGSTLTVIIGAISVVTFVACFVLLKPKWGVAEPTEPPPVTAPTAPPTAYSGV